MRLFFAVVAAERVKKVVKKAVDSFPVTVPPWRWIPPENYHMTLKFLGEVEDKFLPSLHDAALRVASNTGSFQIIYGRFGGFPSLSRPRVIFYRIEEGAEELSSLAGLLEDEVLPRGDQGGCQAIHQGVLFFRGPASHEEAGRQDIQVDRYPVAQEIQGQAKVTPQSTAFWLVVPLSSKRDIPLT